MDIINYISALPKELQLGIMAVVAGAITFGLMAMVVLFLVHEKSEKGKDD